MSGKRRAGPLKMELQVVMRVSECKAPSQKRPHDTTTTNQVLSRKKQVRGKQGGLAGLMKMPVEIFAKIASHLLPIDIISISRSNKFFRKMLMDRSSIRIWHDSMNNAEGLPPCPPDMSEPCYLSLLFSKTCSKCGKSSKAKMDTKLRVRLCGPCRNERLITNEEVPYIFQDLVLSSIRSIPPGEKWRHDVRYVLVADLSRIQTEYNVMKKLDDREAFENWFNTSLKAVDQRRKEAEILDQFIYSVEEDREQELEKLREARRSELYKIERRVKELGWSEEDMPSDCFSQYWRAWHALVNQPKPVTERIWVNLQPKVLTLLEARRAERLETQRRRRKVDRRVRLTDLLAAMAQDASHTLTLTCRTSGLFRGYVSTNRPITLRQAFPSLSQTLAWPLFKELYETDSTPEEMETKFYKHWEEIQTLLGGWKIDVRAHFIRQAQASGTTLSSTLVSYTSKSNQFTNLPDDLKSLLRADSIFYTTPLPGNPKRPSTYLRVVSDERLIWSRGPVQEPPNTAPPRLERIHWYPDAHEIAKALLTSVGMPDASYFEAQGYPAMDSYICARCQDTGSKTWDQIIQHYLDQKQQHADIQKGLSDLGIIYECNDVHDLANKDLPMIKSSDTP